MIEKLNKLDIKFKILEKIFLIIGKISIFINKLIYQKRFIIKNNFKVWGNIRLLIDGTGKIDIGENFHAVSNKKRSYFTIFSPCHLTIVHEGIIEIGNNVGLNGNTIVAKKKIYIGDYTMIGPNTIITDHNVHQISSKDRWSSKDNPKEIIIGKNCWIGMNCTILKGVKIGDNTVIGAGSVVIENCDENSVYRGNPAKKIKDI